ncbi:hypothetical protein FVR03_06950 [Pontibacter qinzhouensis]|uniref:Uncharacterized protein n=1 Tax=Pontibacter qinzhouensis TaxID=2603253 RepID=A0A5C8KBH4_9BACT|nr:DUF6687 family protein [Pontibacter qinzhouensis]TXK49115.1 hypothetical protein FVR03_06950 [Pontibacter qinzhouensis]
MTKRRFIPFSELKHRKAIVVDSMHPNGLVLSHWRGAPTPAEVRDNTSAAMVLHALRFNLPGLDLPYVTANHFDIDGFVGVWSLLNLELALENEELLRQMALIGDFRELDLNHPLAGEALKLVCWINAREKQLFYPPFGAEQLPEPEVTLCPKKFAYFLREFGRVLQDPNWEKAAWEEEVGEVLLGYRDMYKPTTKLSRHPDIGLVVLQLPEPLHYYALFSRTQGFDIVLSCYSGNRYELEYKYTTWVDLGSRPTLPRINLAPLAARLNALETSGHTWTYDAITETGPLLRLNGDKLTQVETYDNPTARIIHASSISVEELQEVVVNYFRTAYQGIEPRTFWTWKEIKELQLALPL